MRIFSSGPGDPSVSRILDVMRKEAEITHELEADRHQIDKSMSMKGEFYGVLPQAFAFSCMRELVG
jgi:hypothetical protein